jgi:hypothetical protein
VTYYRRIEIVQGDEAPLEMTLTGDAGEAIGLAGSTVTFNMEPMTGSAGSAHTGPAEIIDESAAPGDADYGRVRYAWSAEDVADAGIYRAQFRVEFADAPPATFPTGYIEIVMLRRVTGA